MQGEPHLIIKGENKMPLWKPSKDPNLYPARWHEVLRALPGRYYLGDWPLVAAVREQRRFNAFKACLRAHPGHPTAKALAARLVRVISIERGEGSWELFVVIQPKNMHEILKDFVD